jgi:hypothetical protein
VVSFDQFKFDQFKQELFAQMELPPAVERMEMKSGDQMLGYVGAGAGSVSIRYLLARGVLR